MVKAVVSTRPVSTHAWACDIHVIRVMVERGSFYVCCHRHREASVTSSSPSQKLISIIQRTSDVATPISPCGLCRQVLKEFCPPEMPVIMAPTDYDIRRRGGEETGGVKTVTLGDLCPLSSFPAARPNDII